MEMESDAVAEELLVGVADQDALERAVVARMDQAVADRDGLRDSARLAKTKVKMR